MSKTIFQVKRIYDDFATSDGYRVLVDRLWSRGFSKERAQLDEWNKDIAPSPELRTWFNHEPAKFAEFAVRYQEELMSNAAVAVFLQSIQSEPVVTLLYGAKDPVINHAVVLRDFLNNHLDGKGVK